MDKQQAAELIKCTFEQPFEKEKFARFARELLNGYEPAPFAYKGNTIHHAFSEQVGSFERLGKYRDADDKRLDILIVHLKKDHSVGHARTMQRNFVAGYLKGNYGRPSAKDAALVAFVSPKPGDWRFSLVKMDTVFDKSSGKPKPVDEFTPARRWSFLVGENERSHTAQSRLAPILAEDENKPTLAVLEDAFSIESVTKEFFIKYRKLFIDTKEKLDKTLKNDQAVKDDFEKKGANTVDFAKKLLGQIVFLYFLQKKGWFGVPKNGAWGSGSKQFLRELFEKKHGSYTNFFNDILEPLFYEALRLDRSHEDHYYSQFKCKIPFLNGGLFDPIFNYDWSKTDILLPDDLFSNNHRTPEGDAGDGILDIFDRYNFTVKEDEPLDKEVAIDPELLGKAYEKFNAIRPDNFSEYKKALKTGEEGKFNKQFGVYYTPREIVHYMCQQSLINYLFTGLNGEPASYEIMGEKNLNLLGNQGKRGQLDITVEHKANPEISKEDIETLILHGEGIKEHEDHINEKGGVSKTYPHKMPQSIRDNVQRIDALLSDIKVCDPAVGSGAFPVGMMSEIVKIRCILDKKKKQTAYEYKRQCIESSLYGVDIDSGAVEIAKLRLWLSLVVDEDDIKSIKPLPNLDYKIVCGDSLVGVEKNIFNNKYYTELEKTKPLYFNETDPRTKKEYKNKIEVLIYAITDGHKEFDFEIYFSEVFHKKGGFDVLIGNPPYVGVKGQGHVIKEYIKNNYRYSKGADIYVAFIEKSIQLIKQNANLFFIVPNKFFGADYGKAIRKYLQTDNISISSIWDLKDENVFENVLISTIVLGLKKERSNHDAKLIQGDTIRYVKQLFDVEGKIQIEANEDDNKILRKIRKQNKLINIADVRTGIMGFEYWKMEPIIHNGIGKNSVRLYTNGNLCRYGDFWENTEIKLYKDKYTKPSIELNPKYLNTNTIDHFRHKPKIIVRGVSKEIAAIIDYEGSGLLVAVHSIIPKTENIQYLLGILNSKLLNWFHLKTIYSIRIPQGSLKYPTSFFESLPIASADKLIKDKIGKAVEQIQSLKKYNSTEDTYDYESRLDVIVYKLYNLTYKEVVIVDPDFALTVKEYEAFSI